MQNQGVVDVTDFAEGINHALQVIAVSHIAVVKAEGLKRIFRILPLAVSQLLQGRGQAADILVNGPLVVIDDDDQVALFQRGVV